MSEHVVILGSGYTGSRIARLMRDHGGFRVDETHRSQIDFTQPGSVEQLKSILTPGCVVIHSIPTLPNAGDRALIPALNTARLIVYLSTTSVYGDTRSVNDTTAAAPVRPGEVARVETERAIEAGPWKSLILRPAGIYGPGRGVHVAMQQGRHVLRGDGKNVVSRIHVEDLASIVYAAVLQGVTGAYPVADEHPCPAAEIAEYCSQLFGLPMPERVAGDGANRRVDGSAIRTRLGLKLKYPSYREGIPASSEHHFQTELNIARVVG